MRVFEEAELCMFKELQTAHPEITKEYIFEYADSLGVDVGVAMKWIGKDCQDAKELNKSRGGR